MKKEHNMTISFTYFEHQHNPIQTTRCAQRYKGFCIRAEREFILHFLRV